MAKKFRTETKKIHKSESYPFIRDLITYTLLYDFQILICKQPQPVIFKCFSDYPVCFTVINNGANVKKTLQNHSGQRLAGGTVQHKQLAGLFPLKK